MPRPEIFSIDSPSVEVRTTRADDYGKWLASGSVTFTLEGGESVSFPFKDAGDRDDAMRQALGGLEAYIHRFDRAAKKLRSDMP